jgi:hypothetical protein
MAKKAAENNEQHDATGHNHGLYNKIPDLHLSKINACLSSKKLAS